MKDNQELTSKELPKLYIDWGAPNGDETAVSFFDENGAAHTTTGVVARYIAEQSKQLTATQQKLDVAVEALEFYTDGGNFELARIPAEDGKIDLVIPYIEDRGKKAKAALNIIGKKL